MKITLQLIACVALVAALVSLFLGELVAASASVVCAVGCGVAWAVLDRLDKILAVISAPRVPNAEHAFLTERLAPKAPSPDEIERAKAAMRAALRS